MTSLNKLPENPSPNIALTPRSMEALKREGILKEDICPKSVSQVQAIYGDNETNSKLV